MSLCSSIPKKEKKQKEKRDTCLRLLTKQDILHFFLQLVSQDSAQELFRRTTIAPYFGVSRIEFQLCCLWIRFVSQGVVCFHSVDLGGHTLDSQYTPRFFVDNLLKGRQVFARLHTKQVISHFFLQLVSQDSPQELFRLTITSDLGVSHIEFQFCCVWTRFVSQDVVCLHSVGFGGSWTFTVFSTFLVVLPYLFLCIYHFPRRHMMSDFIYSFISYRIHYSF
jgi:hypothetical protein